MKRQESARASMRRQVAQLDQSASSWRRTAGVLILSAWIRRRMSRRVHAAFSRWSRAVRDAAARANHETTVFRHVFTRAFQYNFQGRCRVFFSKWKQFTRFVAHSSGNRRQALRVLDRVAKRRAFSKCQQCFSTWHIAARASRTNLQQLKHVILSQRLRSLRHAIWRWRASASITKIVACKQQLSSNRWAQTRGCSKFFLFLAGRIRQRISGRFHQWKRNVDSERQSESLVRVHTIARIHGWRNTQRSSIRLRFAVWRIRTSHESESGAQVQVLRQRGLVRILRRHRLRWLQCAWRQWLVGGVLVSQSANYRAHVIRTMLGKLVLRRSQVLGIAWNRMLRHALLNVNAGRRRFALEQAVLLVALRLRDWRKSSLKQAFLRWCMFSTAQQSHEHHLQTALARRLHAANALWFQVLRYHFRLWRMASAATSFGRQAIMRLLRAKLVEVARRQKASALARWKLVSTHHTRAGDVAQDRNNVLRRCRQMALTARVFGAWGRFAKKTIALRRQCVDFMSHHFVDVRICVVFTPFT